MFLLRRNAQLSIFSVENYYFVALLQGDQTEWGADKWFHPLDSWTWHDSGTTFPASDADQNWDDSQWGQFTLYIKESYFTFYKKNCVCIQQFPYLILF